MGKAKAAAALTTLALLATATIAVGSVVQSGNLRVTVLAQVEPPKLPRDQVAPIAVFVAGHISNPHGGVPPQLRRMTVKVNRHGLLRLKGLPTCHLAQIQPHSSEQALGDCHQALVGSGRLWALVVFPDQRPYRTSGRLLVFNGRHEGKPVVFAHIYTSRPFSTSFVLTFRIHHLSHGPFGTELSTSLPQALGNWGFLDRIKLTLRRRYHHLGKELSFFNAACPAPKGADFVAFPLALASFDFAGGEHLAATVNKSCQVKE